MTATGKILIVDDEAQLVSLLGRFFSRLGFTVFTATNGRDGLKRVEEDEPDLVLLDIRMPGLDGMQVLRRIRARSRDIVVIMITASQDAILASEAMALGAYDFITKPIDFAHLERTVLALFPPELEVTEPELTEPAPSAIVAEAGAAEPLPPPSPLRPEPAGAPTAPPLVSPFAVEPLPPPAETPAVPSFAAAPEPMPVVALVAECFRVADGVTPSRLGRAIEECAARVLESVATGSDGHPHLKTLRLYFEMVRRLEGLSPEQLARLEALREEVAAAS